MQGTPLTLRAASEASRPVDADKLYDKLVVLLHYVTLNQERMEMVMALLDDFKGALAGLEASVDAAIAKLEAHAAAAAGVPDAEVQAAITALEAKKAALDAAVNPAPPPPAG